MKKILLSAIMIIFFASSYAQEKRINLYSAYVFDDSFESYNNSNDYYNGKLRGGYQWGAGLEFLVKDNFGAELLYYHQDTQAPVNSYNIISTSRTLKVGVNYYLLGLTRYVKKGKAEPYGGFLIGAASFNNQEPQPTDQTTNITKFALGLRLGANIWVTDRVAIKLQAQLLTAVQGFGGGFYFGTGGSGASVGTYSTIAQLGLGGGLTFKLGE